MFSSPNCLKKSGWKFSALKRYTINTFMEEESDYAGEIEVVHYLDFLRQHVGWDKVAAAVKKPLEGLRVAPYYGCTLLRPRSVAIESPDTPTMFDDFLKAIGKDGDIFTDKGPIAPRAQAMNYGRRQTPSVSLLRLYQQRLAAVRVGGKRVPYFLDALGDSRQGEVSTLALPGV